MEVFGNVEGLKNFIEKRHSSEIELIKLEKEKQLKEADKKLKKELELLRSHMKTLTDADVKKAYSKILSEEKLKAKKVFEEKREAIINSVFAEAEKKAAKIVHTSEYINFVKRNMPQEKGLLVIGDSNYYKKAFPKIKVDKSILGLKFESEGAIYDFTLDNLIASKKEILRQEVSRVLFG